MRDVRSMHEPIDPLWLACLDAVRLRIGHDAPQGDVLWSTAIAFLFAIGELSDGRISVSLH